MSTALSSSSVQSSRASSAGRLGAHVVGILLSVRGHVGGTAEPTHRAAIDSTPLRTPFRPRSSVTYVGQSASAPTRAAGLVATRPGRRRRAVRGRRGGVRRAHQAAGHRAAAAHHRAGDVLRRARASRRSAWSSRPSSAARSRPARRRRSTASTTATSTSRCAAPGAGRCRATSSRPRAALVFGVVLGVLSTVVLLRCGSTRCRRRWRCWPTRSTSSSTRCCSSAGPPRTSSGAAWPAASRR